MHKSLGPQNGCPNISENVNAMFGGSEHPSCRRIKPSKLLGRDDIFFLRIGIVFWLMNHLVFNICNLFSTIQNPPNSLGSWPHGDMKGISINIYGKNEPQLSNMFMLKHLIYPMAFFVLVRFCDMESQIF